MRKLPGGFLATKDSMAMSLLLSPPLSAALLLGSPASSTPRLPPPSCNTPSTPSPSSSLPTPDQIFARLASPDTFQQTLELQRELVKIAKKQDAAVVLRRSLDLARALNTVGNEVIPSGKNH